MLDQLADLTGILRGCILFYSDLMKNISVDCNMDFMCLSSYAGGTATTGQVRTMLDLRESIKGRHVVIVEDIVDTGLTRGNRGTYAPSCSLKRE